MTRLRLLVALCTGVLLLASCGNGDGEDGAALSEAPASTVGAAGAPSLVGPSTTTTGPPAIVDAGRSGAGPGASSSTTAAGGSGNATQAPPTATASAVPPPAPGTYRYDTNGVSSYPALGRAPSPYPAVTTLVVDPPAGTRQHATRNLKDTSGNGPIFETRFDYRPDGVYLESLQLTVSVLIFADTLEFRPPVPTLLLPTDARPGYVREFDVPGRVAPAHLVIDYLRDERVRVAGQDVAASVIRLTASTTGQFSARMELTVWLARATGVWVKERSASEATTPEGATLYQGQYEATVQRVTPS